MRVSNYRVAVGFSLKGITGVVNGYIDEGWEPVGGVQVHNSMFTQAMVKCDDPDACRAEEKVENEEIEYLVVCSSDNESDEFSGVYTSIGVYNDGYLVARVGRPGRYSVFERTIKAKSSDDAIVKFRYLVNTLASHAKNIE